MKNHLLLFLLVFFYLFANGQTDKNKLPASFQFEVKNDLHFTKIEAHPLLPVSKEPAPLLAGYTIPLDETILLQGQWKQTNSGVSVWRLALQLTKAEGINLYFEHFNLPEGDELFIYNLEKSIIEGPFTEAENADYFVSDFIKGNTIIVELNTSKQNRELPFQLEELGVSVRQTDADRNFGDSQACEVPVNCPEGDDWQNEKGGVSRILVKSGTNLWWCTGSLVNNTRNDSKPYFLTANHCGQSASETDYAAWKFYFNYESNDCERPLTEPESMTLTGSKLLATSPNSTETGSDFKLLLITDEIPEYFHPWFNGWDRSGDVSPNGICIHHPEGDIQMISTYDQPIVSTRYNNPNPDENGIYWKVNWAETQTNHGVTEPGSSGSPLFNSSGNIIGNLTGGQASCNFPEQPDYYGKFSYSWESNGSDSSQQLKYWLDPDHTAVFSLNGSNFNPSGFFSDFSADSKEIKLGESVQFINRSGGNIDSYEWVFSNGEPSSFTGENPPQIRYKTAGNFDVSLTVSNADDSDINLKKAYIHVKPLAFPNPTNGKVNISFGKEGADLENIQLFAYDITGRELHLFTQLSSDESGIIIDLSTQSRGMYLIKLVTRHKTQLLKVIVSE